MPANIELPAGVTLDAAPKSMLALRGVGGLDTTLLADLAKGGWRVTQLLDQATNPAQNPLQQPLSLENLRRFQCVALIDIPATRLGLGGCAALKEYVRLGGSLLIFGGVNTLNRGRYFGSPLAECLPVTGEDGWETLRRTREAPGYEYAYRVEPKPGSRALPGGIELVAGDFGRGRVIVCPWTTLGDPANPYWRSPEFASAITDQGQGLSTSKP